MGSCPRCERDLPPGALFCAFCGTPTPPPEEAEGDPFIGQTFRGVYFVQQRIGGGGMGQVYKGQHVTLESPVAIKILKRALLADPAVVQRFQREARAASRLRHRNVIAVTDFGQAADGTLFMVMEYVAGRSLAEIIATDSPMPERRVVRIGEQILAALVDAHADGILHRDLKPENVMVESRRDERDWVKVLDFGIAKILEPGMGNRTLTQDGLVCGTPGYMSPEQWEGAELDARSDLYAVGVVLYEMLTGELPVEGRTPLELARKHLVEKPVPPSVRCPDRTFSPDLEALVMRTLSVDRTERPSSAEEMRQALLACMLLPGPEADAAGETRGTAVLERASPAPTPRGGAPVAVTVPAPRVPPPVRRTPERSAASGRSGDVSGRSKKLVVPFVIALLLAAVALGAWFGLRRAPSGEARPAMATRVEPPPAVPTPPSTAPAGLDAKPVDGPARPAPAEGTPPQPAVAPLPSPPAAGQPARSREPPRVREPLEVRDSLGAIATPPASSGQGVLSVLVEPFGEVLLEGRAYGEAPREFRLRSGRYLVVATHPKLGRREERVLVPAGQRVTRTVVFQVP